MEFNVILLSVFKDSYIKKSKKKDFLRLTPPIKETEKK